MSDTEAIRGLWRLVSTTTQGRPIGGFATHYLFGDGTFRPIEPSRVDAGKVRATFELDEEADPKEIAIIRDFNGPDGPPSPEPHVQRGFYALEGSTLRLCWGPRWGLPSAFSDENDMLVTLERDHGPVPETRKPSGRAHLVDDILGRMIWDDNLHWYEGEVEVGGRTVAFSLNADDEGDVDAPLERARAFFADFDRQDASARDHAVATMLAVKNGGWMEDGEEPLTPDSFKSRMDLESVQFDPDGDVTFYYADGDLFWGHTIQVNMDGRDEFTAAHLAG